MKMTPHALGLLHSLHMAKVVDNVDPDSRGRIKVMIVATELEVWASVVVASAGEGYGISCLPKVEEIVVVAFVTPEQPLILGSIWAGQSSAPEDADTVEDHYVIRTPQGTVMEFDDGDGPKMEVRTPEGYSVTVTDGNGGEIALTRGEQSVVLNSSGIEITSSSTVSIKASTFKVEASTVQADASIANFSGVVKTDTTIASSAVVGSSYTPGAGNIW